MCVQSRTHNVDISLSLSHPWCFIFYIRKLGKKNLLAVRKILHFRFIGRVSQPPTFFEIFFFNQLLGHSLSLSKQLAAVRRRKVRYSRNRCAFSSKLDSLLALIQPSQTDFLKNNFTNQSNPSKPLKNFPTSNTHKLAFFKCQKKRIFFLYKLHN